MMKELEIQTNIFLSAFNTYDQALVIAAIGKEGKGKKQIMKARKLIKKHRKKLQKKLNCILKA